jgi:hypothetical protein
MPEKKKSEKNGTTARGLAPKGRDYPGYEDYSPGGRAAIKAFNAARGPYFLGRKDSKGPYDRAVKKANEARKLQGKRGAGLGG